SDATHKKWGCDAQHRFTFIFPGGNSTTHTSPLLLSCGGRTPPITNPTRIMLRPRSGLRVTANRYATAGARCRRIFLLNPSRSTLTLGPPRRHVPCTAFPLAQARRDSPCRRQFVRNQTFWQRTRLWPRQLVPPYRKKVGQNNGWVCAGFYPRERLSRFYELERE